jgi:phage gp29-like protein
MVSCGDGLMFASSIAHIFKQLPLKDWLIYCERNGMPGIKATTDAFPGSPQWQAACEAVNDFGAEFHAVLSKGTDIEAIDVSTSGELPYPALVERMDRILCALWRGSDLSTISGGDKVGASAQWYESTLIEEEDAANIGETLNRQVDARVIKLAIGDDEPLAKFRLKLPDYEEHKCELEIVERLAALGLKPDAVELAKRFAFPMAGKDAENEIQ